MGARMNDAVHVQVEVIKLNLVGIGSRRVHRDPIAICIQLSLQKNHFFNKISSEIRENVQRF